MYEVAGSQVTCAGDECAARRDVFEGVLPDVIASLKKDRAAVEINAMVRASILLCLGMSH